MNKRQKKKRLLQIVDQSEQAKLLVRDFSLQNTSSMESEKGEQRLEN